MKKRFLLTSILMLLLTVLALSTSTYAWFSMSTTNNVSEFTITAASSTGGLEISKNGTTWTSGTVAFNDPTTKALDVTSADGVTFTKGGKNTDDTTNAAAPSAASQPADYYQFKLYFRTSSNGEIQVQPKSSYIVPACYKDLAVQSGSVVSGSKFVADAVAKENDSTKIDWTNATAAETYNKSSGGDFSRDWIAASARISFTVTGYQNSINQNYSSSSATTISNYNVEVFDTLRYAQLGQDPLTGTWDVIKNTSASIDAEPVYKYVRQSTETTSANYNKWKLGEEVTYSITELMEGDDVTIAKLSTAATSATNLQTTKGNNFIVEVTARIWIEGQDNEADLPLTAGKFTTALQFGFVQGDAFEDKGVVGINNFEYKNGGFNWTNTEGLTGLALYKGTVTNETTSLDDLVKIADMAAGSYVYPYADYTKGESYVMIAKYANGTYDANNSFKVAKGTTPETYDFYTYAVLPQTAVELTNFKYEAGSNAFSWNESKGLTGFVGIYEGKLNNDTDALPAAPIAATGYIQESSQFTYSNSSYDQTKDYTLVFMYANNTASADTVNKFIVGEQYYTYVVYEQQSVKISDLAYADGKFTWKLSDATKANKLYLYKLSANFTAQAAEITALETAANTELNAGLTSYTTEVEAGKYYVLVTEYNATTFPYVAKSFENGGKHYTYVVFQAPAE